MLGVNEAHFKCISLSFTGEERSSIGLNRTGQKSEYPVEDVSTSVVETTCMRTYCQRSNYIYHNLVLSYVSYFQK